MNSAAKFPVRHCLEVSEGCLAFNLRRADRLLTQIYDEALRPAGIRGTQYSLLVGLRAMEPATMSALSAQLGLDRTTLTRNLKILEDEQLATSEPGEDLRERRIVLTPKGHRALHTAYPRWKAAQARIEKQLRPGGFAALLKDLGALSTLRAS